MMEETSQTASKKLLEKRMVPTMSDVSTKRPQYATVCVTLNPSETPAPFLKKVLAISALKLGSSNVRLASQVMIVLNVCFNRRAGLLTPEVLLIKDPAVFSFRAGEAKARENK
jgi:hypothetical protein